MITINRNTREARTTNWDVDDKPDLVTIKKNGTPRAKTEVHIYSGASNYSTPLLQVETGLHVTNESWQFLIADWDLDGTPDLWAINQHGANGHCDLHILSGADHFQSFIAHITLPLY